MGGENSEVILLQGRLNGQQRARLGKLLDMMYTPRELSEEIGFTVRQVYRVYLPAGCPHERDNRNHIWINGKTFREWVEDVYKKRKLSPDQAFCLTCRRPVKMSNPKQEQEGRLVYYVCECPHCGRKLARIVERKKRGVL